MTSPNIERVASLHFVVPSLSAPLERLKAILELASSVRATCAIVANSRSLARRLDEAGLPYVTTETNPGFAASVNFGARQNSWDWVVILNDDVTFDSGAFAEALTRLSATPHHTSTVHFDMEAARPIPDVKSVLLNVSLVGAVLRRLFRPRSSGGRGTYRSFSAVAIRRDIWENLGGLNESYGFTFEDADFARRAWDRGFASVALSEPVAHHLHSVTTNRWIASVLPVSTYSAYSYLSQWYGWRPVMAGLLVLALICRIPFSLVRPNSSAHLLGIVRSMSAVLRNRRPELPRWEDV